MWWRRLIGPIAVFAVVGWLTGVAVSSSNPIPQDPPPSRASNHTDGAETQPEVDQSMEMLDNGDVEEGGGALACTAPSQRLNFNTSWAGPEFGGLPLTAVIRECEETVSEGSTRTNFVSYLYGSCDPDPDGCAVPIEIQSWPSESRNHPMYHPSGPLGLPVWGTLPHQDVVFNGVPALVTEARLELFYPDVAVVIFGEDRELRESFARSLQPGVRVLTELSQYDVGFQSQCVDEPGYCEGYRSA